MIGLIVTSQGGVGDCEKVILLLRVVGYKFGIMRKCFDLEDLFVRRLMAVDKVELDIENCYWLGQENMSPKWRLKKNSSVFWALVLVD